MQNIFVYGTLKRGHERQSALKAQTFLSVARTEPRYWMFSLGSYPGLVDADADQRDPETGDQIAGDSFSGDSISGEVYRVDAKCRRVLDEIEEVDVGLYELREVHLENTSDFEPVFAYFYLGSVAGCERLLTW